MRLRKESALRECGREISCRIVTAEKTMEPPAIAGGSVVFMAILCPI